jgi:RNA polymerase sigma factor (TIGR02999 family)
MSDVTRFLEAAQAGDRQAAQQLLPLVYDELRKLAAARMTAEAPGNTLDATALVHEAYLRLVADQHFDGRGHFFAAAAEAMRRILVNHARDRKRLKRGSGRVRVDLLDQVGSVAEDPDLVLSLDELLARILTGGRCMTIARSSRSSREMKSPMPVNRKGGRRRSGSLIGRRSAISLARAIARA